jgi:hypothetical protein
MQPESELVEGYVYIVANMMGCAIGVSDYHFSCVVDAASKQEAAAWGHEVAVRYSERFGFAPHGLRIGPKEIATNAFVFREKVVQRGDDEEEAKTIACRAGELPSVLRDVSNNA